MSGTAVLGMERAGTTMDRNGQLHGHSGTIPEGFSARARYSGEGRGRDFDKVYNDLTGYHMPMSLPRLTAEEKILLHLSDWIRSADDYERPPEVTQSGIAEATSIKRGYVAIVLSKMVDKGHVEVTLSRIRGKARSQKSYILTPDGLSESTKLRNGLDPCTVFVDGAEVPFSFAVNSGFSPLQVIKLSELGEDIGRPVPPPEPDFPDDEENTSENDESVPEDDAHRDVPPPSGYGDRMDWRDIAAQKEEILKGLISVTLPAGIALLLATFILVDNTLVLLMAYIPGLMFLSGTMELGRRAGITWMPMAVAAIVLVHLSYLIRGFSHPDTPMVPLMAFSLFVFYKALPERRSREMMMSVAGTMLVLQGIASMIPASGQEQGHVEAWLVLGVMTVLLSGKGWGIGIPGLRGISLGAGIYSIIFVPYYALSDIDDPRVIPVAFLIAGVGIVLIIMSRSNWPIRRILYGAALLSIGASMGVLSVTLYMHELPTAALVEAFVAVAIIAHGVSLSRIKKLEHLGIAVILASAPTAALAYGLTVLL